MDEISLAQNITKADLGASIKLIVKSFNLEDKTLDSVVFDVFKSFGKQSLNFLNLKFSDFNLNSCLLGLLPSVEITAMGIAQKANELAIVPGCSPISVAAAALFMALQVSDVRRYEGS